MVTTKKILYKINKENEKEIRACHCKKSTKHEESKRKKLQDRKQLTKWQQ